MQQITGLPVKHVISQRRHGLLRIRLSHPVAQAVMLHTVLRQNLRTTQQITGLPVKHVISQTPRGLLRIRLQQQVVQAVMHPTALL